MTDSSSSSIVSKCARFIDIFTEAQRPLEFKEFMDISGLSKSTTHRILKVLISENLIELDKINKVYHSGPRMIAWGQATWQRLNLQTGPSADLKSICESTKMNVALSILDSDSILYLRTHNYRQVHHASHPGDHAPLHCTAAGKVFLANLSEFQQTEMLNRLRFEQMTEHTIMDPKKLQQELKEISRKGYAICNKEEYLRIIGIAAPIRDIQGEISACLSLWTLLEDASLSDVKKRIPQLLAITGKLSELNGYE